VKALSGRMFRSLRIRTYRLFFFGQLVSMTGTWMQSVAQAWLVLRLTESGVALGVVIALQFLPILLFGVWGGVIADRVDKRRLLIVTQAVALAEALALFVLTITDVVQIWHILALAVVIGLAQALEMPARTAFIVELVPRDAMPNAMALGSVAFNGARVIGPAIGGITIALFGVAANFGINAFSFVAVLIGLLRIDPAAVRRPERPAISPRLLESLAEGFRFAAANEPIRWSLILLLGLAIFGMQFTILVPLFTRLELGLGPEALGGFFAVYGAGSLVGSVLLAFRQERSVRLEVLAASAVFVVAELVLGLTTWLPAVFVLLAACGFFSIVTINTINVTIQQRVTDVLRARVMSLYVLVLIGSAPIGALFAGGVAELLRPSAAFVVGAIISALVLGLAGWRLRTLP